jgi:hypothetical protein
VAGYQAPRDKVKKLRQFPNVIGELSLHRGGDPQGHVNPAEVVVHEVQSDGRSVVLDLLARSVGQPREPAHAHSHREVLPLDKAGRNVVGIRVADDRLNVGSQADLRIPWTMTNGELAAGYRIASRWS